MSTYETISITKFRERIIWRLRVHRDIDIESYREYLIRLRSNGHTRTLRGSFYRSKKQFIIINPNIDPKKMRRGVLEIIDEL